MSGASVAQSGQVMVFVNGARGKFVCNLRNFGLIFRNLHILDQESAMTVDYRILSVSEFGRTMVDNIGWVRHMGGRLWLTNHGRNVASVVPVYQCEMLERWDGLKLDEERRRIEAGYRRMERMLEGE
jgi:hypothetical protein